jgi:hypothetical protein
LTIKSISNTKCSMSFLRSPPLFTVEVALLVVNNARQIFNCQRSDFFVTLKTS